MTWLLFRCFIIHLGILTILLGRRSLYTISFPVGGLPEEIWEIYDSRISRSSAQVLHSLKYLYIYKKSKIIMIKYLYSSQASYKNYKYCIKWHEIFIFCKDKDEGETLFWSECVSRFSTLMFRLSTSCEPLINGLEIFESNLNFANTYIWT